MCFCLHSAPFIYISDCSWHSPMNIAVMYTTQIKHISSYIYQKIDEGGRENEETGWGESKREIFLWMLCETILFTLHARLTDARPKILQRSSHIHDSTVTASLLLLPIYHHEQESARAWSEEDLRKERLWKRGCVTAWDRESKYVSFRFERERERELQDIQRERLGCCKREVVSRERERERVTLTARVKSACRIVFLMNWPVPQLTMNRRVRQQKEIERYEGARNIAFLTVAANCIKGEKMIWYFSHWGNQKSVGSSKQQ